jgi:hypothetical protein
MHTVEDTTRTLPRGAGLPAFTEPVNGEVCPIRLFALPVCVKVWPAMLPNDIADPVLDRECTSPGCPRSLGLLLDLFIQ